MSHHANKHVYAFHYLKKIGEQIAILGSKIHTYTKVYHVTCQVILFHIKIIFLETEFIVLEPIIIIIHIMLLGFASSGITKYHIMNSIS